MEILLWILFGAVVGWIATLITGTDARYGMVGNIVVGIVGAILGGFIVQLFGGDNVTAGFNFYSILVAIGGSILLIWLIQAFRRGTDTTTRGF